MDADNEWVDIFMTYDTVEAELIRGLLESGGISVMVKSFKVAPYPVNIGKMGEIRILVRRGDKGQAELIIKGL